MTMTEDELRLRFDTLDLKLNLLLTHFNLSETYHITGVVKRVAERHDLLTNAYKMANIIDFYVPHTTYASGKTFGEHPVASLYLDTGYQIGEFEWFAGLKVEDMPPYNQDAAFQQRAGRVCKEMMPVDFTIMVRKPTESDDRTRILQYLYGDPTNVHNTRQKSIQSPDLAPAVKHTTPAPKPNSTVAKPAPKTMPQRGANLPNISSQHASQLELDKSKFFHAITNTTKVFEGLEVIEKVVVAVCDGWDWNNVDAMKAAVLTVANVLIENGDSAAVKKAAIAEGKKKYLQLKGISND